MNPGGTLSLARHLRRHLGHAVVGARTRLPTTKPVVALTFDDGPDPDTTPTVLDILVDHNARATFFLVGERAQQHPEIVARILADGHAVGSHSQAHAAAWLTPPDELLVDYRTGHDSVTAVVGGPVPAFRPPNGHMAARTALGQRMLPATVWLWSLDTEDWRASTSTAQIVDTVRRATPGDVVLLHDALAGAPLEDTATDRKAHIAALPGVLDVLADAGLRPIPLPALRRP